MITPQNLTYFLWSEISKELLTQGFTETNLETYQKEFLRKNPNRDELPKPGSICGFNLYFFGPTPTCIQTDPEEAQRAKSVFGWAYEPENELSRKITHSIWDILKDQLTNEMIEDTLIKL